MKLLTKCKKGFSVGYSWIYSLVTLFSLGILFITFNQVLRVYLVPVIKDLSNSSIGGIGNIPPETTIVINAAIDKYMVFFDALPFIMFFTVVIYMVVAAIRKEGESQYR